MDPTLERCWKSGTAPFDGVTVYDASDDEITLLSLRHSALAVVEILQQKFPAASLRIFDDWHEHDGFISPSSKTTWSEVRDRLTSDDSFLFFKTGDFQVSKAIYPEGLEFFLRIYIDEEAKPGDGVGELDVTVPLNTAGTISDALRSLLKPKTESARSYFEKRYGG